MRLALLTVAILATQQLVSARLLFGNGAEDANKKYRRFSDKQQSKLHGPPSSFVSFQTSGSVRSDPTMASVSTTFFVGSSDGTLYAANAFDFSLNFTFKSGASIYSSPAVCSACGSVFYGDQAGNFFDLATTGALQWMTNISAPITGQATIYNPTDGSDALVIFGSYDGNIYALRQKDGSQAWNVTTGSFVSASAAITTTIWGVDVVVIGSQDGTLYGLEAPTGKEMWKFADGGDKGQADPIANGCAITSSGAALCSARNGRFFAVNVSTGIKIFERQRFSGTPNSRPVLSRDQNMVYVAADFNRMHALSVRTGETVWSYTHPSSYLNTAPVHFTTRSGVHSLVFGTDDDNTTLVSLDASTGAIQWITTVPGNGGPVTTAPLFSSLRDKIIFGTAGGIVFGADVH